MYLIRVNQRRTGHDTIGIIRINQRRTGHKIPKGYQNKSKKDRPVLPWFILIIPMVSYGLSFFDLFWLSLWYLMACPSLIYSDYPYGILWPVLLWFILIIPLVSYGLSFFDLFWLSLWYLMACPSLIYSDYPLVSYGLSFFDLLWLSLGILWPVLLWFTLIIPLVS